MVALASTLAVGGAVARPATTGEAPTEAVVLLARAPLAEAAAGRTLAAATRRNRLDLRAPASASYLATLTRDQDAAFARIRAAIPSARIQWRYRVVLNGLAVVVPRDALPRLRALRVGAVVPSVRYRALLDRTPRLVGATQVWGPDLATAGQGMKIAIIDDGVDQSHQFFSPTGFKYPPGFPKGQTTFTTPKVIVARAFAPAGETWKYARRPFDPQYSDHATHVAGIAAGDHNVRAQSNRVVSGIAPSAYIGNYKALTVPTRDFGLDGNAPEIAAAIEAAVRDGMDVINLSLGEPEIEPSRDIVVKALNAAADAGVVPCVAAGNDYDEFGRGSVSSPANAQKAITAAASTAGHGGAADVIADFSSAGPTPVSLQMKPDVTAPGRSILSSVPRREGSWAEFDGTSMASPHVAGAAAILRERHPTWTVAQIKSALELTGDPVYADDAHTTEVTSTREGGGRIDLVQADRPLVFTDPTGISFGLVGRSVTKTVTLDVTDAGGGGGAWNVTVSVQAPTPGISVTAPATADVPGTLPVTVRTDAAATERELTGFVVLSRGTDRRRVPFWLRVSAPALATSPHTTLRRTGTYRGNTAGRPSRVSTYRYPDAAPGVPTTLDGPEQVFRVTLRRPVANFGVAVVSHARGVSIQPRVVYAGNEDRLVGYTGLPLNLNPYGDLFGRVEPIVGAVLPAAGAYDVVFDTVSRSRAGRFAFRFWIGDTRPPSARVVAGVVRAGAPVAVVVRDGGSGVDPASLSAAVDGASRAVDWTGTRALVRTAGLRPGAHTLVFRASDRQEAKNMEDVGPVLPNTRTIRVRFTVRRAS